MQEHEPAFWASRAQAVEMGFPREWLRICHKSGIPPSDFGLIFIRSTSNSGEIVCSGVVIQAFRELRVGDAVTGVLSSGKDDCFDVMTRGSQRFQRVFTTRVTLRVRGDNVRWQPSSRKERSARSLSGCDKLRSRSSAVFLLPRL